MATVYTPTDLGKLSHRKIFVDANVLIYLFWSTGHQKWEDGYAKIFRTVQHQSNQLYLDFLVVSEVINRMLRMEHSRLLQFKSDFKKFRNSKDGQEATTDIYHVVKEKILSQFNTIERVFSQTDLSDFLQADHLDFTDKAILKICQENDFVLLTHDRDFKFHDIDILTCNFAI